MPDSVQGWGGGASVSHQIAVGERCKLSQQGLGQSVSKGGCANPPWGQKLRDPGGVINCSARD